MPRASRGTHTVDSRKIAVMEKGRMAESYRVTSVGMTPAEDRAKRMRFYFVAMSLRVACIASLFFVRGWWVLLVGIGAVILPYLAVMIGNAASNLPEERPDAPQPLELSGAELQQPESEPQTIVVDVPSYRRSSEAAPPAHDEGAA